MIDILTQERRARGRQVPKRIPVRPDMVQIVRIYCKGMLQVCDEWKM